MRMILRKLAALGWFILALATQAVAFEAQSTWGGTAGGSANAVTVAIANVQSLNDILGVPLRFVPAADNTGAATIAVNNLAATAVRRPSNIGLVALSGGELQAGVTTTIMYNGNTIEILGPVDMTPIGRTVEFRGSVTPRGTLIEDGSCISTATFAALFSVIGRNYGACDGTTTFGLPNSKGRTFVALDNQGSGGAANVVTSAGSGCDATGIGNCGSQSRSLLRTDLPNTNVTVTITDPGHAHGSSITQAQFALSSGSTGPFLYGPSIGGGAGTIIASNTTGISAAFNLNGAVTQTAVPTLPPISLGRRAIKY